MHTTESPAPEIGPGLPLIAIFALASLTAVGPLAIDMYLAALPAIASDLGTTAPTVQLTLTAFLAGMGAGQFIVGPLSDRQGAARPSAHRSGSLRRSNPSLCLCPPPLSC